MNHMNRIAILGLGAALMGMPITRGGPPLGEVIHQAANAGAPRPWRTKLRDTRTTVAAMKRQARKRRNVRARASKRRA